MKTSETMITSIIFLLVLSEIVEMIINLAFEVKFMWRGGENECC